MKPVSEDNDRLHSVVYSELKKIGVKLPKAKKLKLSSNKQEKSINNGCKKTFGAGLSDQEWIFEDGCIVPKFIAITTKYLKRYLSNEGLFRIPGSSVRKEELKLQFENNEAIDGAEPNDVASLMKQWLRELPEPIFPSYLQDVFLRCQLISLEEKRIEATMLSCLLLPSEHLCTLTHLLRFLSEFASHSNVNKMDAHNIALIMAPNLLSMSCERAEKASSSLLHHTSLVELLIKNAHRVGLFPPSIEVQLQGEKTSVKYDELNSSFDVLDSSPLVSKKKRRSGPVHELVNGIRKFVGQSLTPVCPNRDESSSERQAARKTPGKRSGWKRKADRELDPLPAKKRSVEEQQKEISGKGLEHTPVGKAVTCPDSLTTPKTRANETPKSRSGKPFSLLSGKRRNRRKSACKSSVVAKKNQFLEVTDKPSPNFYETDSKDKVLGNISAEFIDSVAVGTGNHLSPSPRDTKCHITQQYDEQLQCTPASDLHTECLLIKTKVNTPTAVHQSPVSKIPCVENLTAPQNVNKLDDLSLNHSLDTSNQSNSFDGASLGNAQFHVRNSESFKHQDNKKTNSFSKLRPSDIPKCISTNQNLVSGCENVRNVHPVSKISQSKSINKSISRLNSVSKEVKLKANVKAVQKSVDITLLNKTGETSIHLSKCNISSKRSLRRGRPNTINTGLPSELCPKQINEDEKFGVKISENSRNKKAHVMVKKSVSCKELESTERNVKKNLDISNAKCISIEKFLSDISPSIFSSTQFGFTDDYEECKKVISPCAGLGNKEKNLQVKHCTPSTTSSEISSKCASDKETSPMRNKFQFPECKGLYTPISLSNDSDHDHIKNCSSTSESHNLSEVFSEYDLSKKTKKCNISRSFSQCSPLVSSRESPKSDNIVNVTSGSAGLPFCDDDNLTNVENSLNMQIFDDISSTKRESIVQLMIKNAGKVQANVHHFNHISNLRTISTPTCGSEQVVEHNSSSKRRSMSVKDVRLDVSSPIQQFHSRNTSAESTSNVCNTRSSSLSVPRCTKSKSKEKFRKSPIPPPPKFIVTSVDNLSPHTSYPLKELINVNKAKDKTPIRIPRLYSSFSPNDKQKCFSQDKNYSAEKP